MAARVIGSIIIAVLLGAWAAFNWGIESRAWEARERRERIRATAGYEAAKDRDRKAGIREWLADSAIAAGIVSYDADPEYGLLTVTVDEAMTVAWDRASCDIQRNNMAVLMSAMERHSARPSGTWHRVELLSFSGRVIGSVERSIFSGMVYDCD